ncbi:MAG: DNA polymerase/3'-5' exonuclease PolX [Saprospiraceae bacterium]|nr:DNA polymerase/3'-5' exonuclease PolX [Saprospiraceae bacterium]
MTNKEIARYFNKLGKIMDLHDENPFKTRSYYNAYNTLRKVEKPFAEMESDELINIKGVGKAIYAKINELIETGELETYNKYADVTPQGVIEMLKVRGFGPKKIKTIWRDLGIETIGELLYACNENRLIELKGFGAKTQESLKQQLQYFIDSQGKYLYAYIEDEAMALLQSLKSHFPDGQHELCGALRQKDPIIEGIEILTTVSEDELKSKAEEMSLKSLENKWFIDDYPVHFIHTNEDDFVWQLFLYSSSEEFIDALGAEYDQYENEEAIFEDLGLPYIIPELRHNADIIDLADQGALDEVIDVKDIKGLVHSHTTWSDGVHTLKEMADHAQKLGMEYLVNSDHSKAAFYANGLDEDRVWAQFEEIDQLNEGYDGFRIFKSIEADILNDGSMDYGTDFLSHFDLVIASIHSNLKMDEEKANQRLITAIENPNTHILGHPTGRLLLSREGYPIDHMKIIDACAANGMVIELNSNPLRLDLDWTWIGYALEKGVMISINPDSHSKEQIEYIKYGVYVARKARLTPDMCLNTKDLEEFSQWVKGL